MFIQNTREVVAIPTITIMALLTVTLVTMLQRRVKQVKSRVAAADSNNTTVQRSDNKAVGLQPNLFYKPSPPFFLPGIRNN